MFPVEYDFRVCWHTFWVFCPVIAMEIAPVRNPRFLSEKRVGLAGTRWDGGNAECRIANSEIGMGLLRNDDSFVNVQARNMCGLAVAGLGGHPNSYQT